MVKMHGRLTVTTIILIYCAKPSVQCTSCCKPSRQQQLVQLKLKHSIVLDLKYTQLARACLEQPQEFFYYSGITRNYVTVTKCMCVMVTCTVQYSAVQQLAGSSQEAQPVIIQSSYRTYRQICTLVILKRSHRCLFCPSESLSKSKEGRGGLAANVAITSEQTIFNEIHTMHVQKMTQ